MNYSWNKPLENLPEEITTIWSCTKNGCKGWIRDNFSFEDVPTCMICKSVMVRSEKVLPILISSDHELKQHRKNQRKAAL
ncbi:cold-shock protein [Cohnella sp. GCM10020058]|uniref:cold-shock protein n=1 Tax=Cohnella sp. GCM10020058 TaxID=3317330 RepID=UPI003637CFF2